MELNIVYEDREIVVVEKPVGVLSQKGKENEADMLSLLDAYFEEKEERSRAYVLHRLDREVGGVMVYAKNAEGAAKMSAVIAAGQMRKCYFALCHGDVAASLGEKGELRDLLFKDSAKNKSYVTSRMRKGVKEAWLTYRVVASGVYEGERVSLVFVTLGTGRTHQIRVQFSSRGHSLVGDARYGSDLRGRNIALFSAELAFCHPRSKQDLQFSLPLPRNGVWEGFRKEGAE